MNVLPLLASTAFNKIITDYNKSVFFFYNHVTVYANCRVVPLLEVHGGSVVQPLLGDAPSDVGEDCSVGRPHAHHLPSDRPYMVRGQAMRFTGGCGLFHDKSCHY